MKIAILVSIGLSIVAVLTSTGCESSTSGTVEGIIQTVDTTQGVMTVQLDTHNSRTIQLTSNTKVMIGEREADLSTLEPGLRISTQIEGETSQLIEINLAQLEAFIVALSIDRIILQPVGSSQQVTLGLKEFSIIHRDGIKINLSDLHPGMIAKALFCTATATAYEIEAMPQDYRIEQAPEGSRIEGVVTRFRLDQLNVTGIGGIARGIWLDKGTKIVFEDGSPATRDDIVYWDWVVVYYDPKTVVATLVKISPVSHLRYTGPLNQVDNR